MKIRWKFLTVPVLWTAFLSSAVAADAELPANARADRVIVLKSQRELRLMRNGVLLKSYKISLGGNPVGPKERQGDSRTPEGLYTISGRNPGSRFHLSLRISYPTPEQSERARKGGYSTGGDIFIHGLPNGWGAIGKGHLLKDWTDGCIAVTNPEIEEIWRAVPNGTILEIQP